MGFVAFGIKFHYGICLLQNIDFVSWWAPMYMFFLVDVPGGDAAGILQLFAGAAAASFELAPTRTVLAASYVVVHCITLAAMRWYPSREILPLSAFPMFKNSVDLFDPACRKWHWLSDKPHETGTLKNYCFPFCRPQTVLPEEQHQLPFKYCLIGHGGEQDDSILTNVVLTTELTAAINAM